MGHAYGIVWLGFGRFRRGVQIIPAFSCWVGTPHFHAGQFWCHAYGIVWLGFGRFRRCGQIILAFSCCVSFPAIPYRAILVSYLWHCVVWFVFAQISLRSADNPCIFVLGRYPAFPCRAILVSYLWHCVVWFRFVSPPQFLTGLLFGHAYSIVWSGFPHFHTGQFLGHAYGIVEDCVALCLPHFHVGQFWGHAYGIVFFGFGRFRRGV